MTRSKVRSTPVQNRAIALHKVAQPLRHRQHPLAHRQARENIVGEVRVTDPDGYKIELIQRAESAVGVGLR